MKEIVDINELKHYNHIHMVGIGGISMSGIAEILKNWGFTVTGYDATGSDITEKLISHGINVTLEHDLKYVHTADLVVYTAAIKQDDPELVEARNMNIPCIERKDFLGIITKSYINTIGISGTHGKTTTTSMVSLCFIEAGLDPTIQVGAILKQLDGNYRVGNSNNLIIESCEYAESFLKFHLKSAIILNIDNDHLDYFKTFDNIKAAFVKYVERLPANGFLVLNADDTSCLELINHTKAKCITYALENENSDYIAKNISFNNDGFGTFDVYKKNELYGTISLSVPGMHNVSNALSCIALCDTYNISYDAIQKALKNFTGANRRLEYVGKCNGASVYDDYGHHPTEIDVTANAMNQKKFNESWVVFQPHTYSRTVNHLDDFAKALVKFDNIIITDIYAARESNNYGVSSEDLVNKIKEYGKDAIYISGFEDIANYIRSNVKENDVVLTLGAGTVVQVGKMLVK